MPIPGDTHDVEVVKQRLRQQARQTRKARPDKVGGSQAVCASVMALPEYRHAETLCTYVGVGDEVLTNDLIRRALAEGKRVVVPFVEGNRLALFRLRSLEELGPAPFGLLEPRPEFRTQANGRVVPSEIECYLVPGLAFGTAGQRLGHGKGYYDGLLGESLPHAHRIGVCFECQLLEGIPMTPRDVFMDLVTTEKAIYRHGG